MENKKCVKEKCSISKCICIDCMGDDIDGCEEECIETMICSAHKTWLDAITKKVKLNEI